MKMLMSLRGQQKHVKDLRIPRCAEAILHPLCHRYHRQDPRSFYLGCCLERRRCSTRLQLLRRHCGGRPEHRIRDDSWSPYWAHAFSQEAVASQL